MRLTEFWNLMETQFGAVYARSLARDYRLTTLAATVEDALSVGVDPKEIWRAVCTEFDVPLSLR